MNDFNKLLECMKMGKSSSKRDSSLKEEVISESSSKDIRAYLRNLLSTIPGAQEGEAFIGTKRGKNASRGLCVKWDIPDIGKVVIFPTPKSAISVKSSKFVRYDKDDPSHENLDKYVRVSDIVYKGDWDESQLTIYAENGHPLSDTFDSDEIVNKINNLIKRDSKSRYQGDISQ